MIREPLIFEISDKGKKAFSFPKSDVPERKDLFEGIAPRPEIPGFPQVAEVEVVRHFTRLSQVNYCVDVGIYPLGSCTMKYNPKINEKAAGLPGFSLSHPLAPEDTVQGNLEDVGRRLLTDYAFVFELISLVLLVAIVGSVVLARRGRGTPGGT